jgi:hypothetical protein
MSGDAFEAEMAAVRAALRRELEALGYRVATDTRSFRGELYVKGDRDLAAALFEFKASAEESFESMYQGRWMEGMPPRFAVLPSSEAGNPVLEMLAQARLHVLFYETAEDDTNGPDAVDFPDLGSPVTVIGPPRG